MYVYDACLFLSVVVTVNVCCVAAVEKNRVFSLGVLKYVCVVDVVFSVCIVRHGAAGARVWEV